MEKKSIDRKDIYMLILIGLFYLFLFYKNILEEAPEISGWEWFPFVVVAIITLAIYSFACLWSCYMVTKAVKYFGLPKNYFVLTILSIVIAPLAIIFLSLILSGFLPSLFDPRFL